ncbi:hypothetical protein RHMOL_Rhmol12G0066700 [Rhododendron molle]|uniref:Uncharacterized protein n=1 Tax=Rhododendron molle TaxID=49168 RepID=A0ACC0LF05_RHOML|nr:hypothetical protein RHMOL_Rhmol12G0066700 [Rhododendron molle]
MPEDIYAERPLFGGAIASTFPVRFQDVSNIRQVPDHQEVFVDPARDESLIVELLDLKHDVADNGSATWFLQDLASEQDAEGAMILSHKGYCGALGFIVRVLGYGQLIGCSCLAMEVIEQSGVVEAHGLRFRNMPAVVTTAVAQMGISKGRQGREAQNVIRVYLANLRLKEVGTDVLITAYEPILINPLSESASSVGAGLAAPAAESGRMPMAEVFKLAVSGFKVNDWGLFGNATG